MGIRSKVFPTELYEHLGDYVRDHDLDNLAPYRWVEYDSGDPRCRECLTDNSVVRCAHHPHEQPLSASRRPMAADWM